MVGELLSQLQAVGEAPARLYFASGSQGTQAGLIVGARAFSAPLSVYGVAVEHPLPALIAEAVELANGTAALLELNAQFQEEDIVIDGDFIGPDYGVATADGLAAIRLLARTEAIFLDPVYIAKAMAALIAHIRAGAFSPDQAVIFLHTGGGPSIFAAGEQLLATGEAAETVTEQRA
jgi:1-aminocyclopropane-1-carboxylate deaminase/D-cysteine desulfhydrase-like pyridoxal-dependent ACC family enzyme